jgi:homeobox protein cut-like
MSLPERVVYAVTRMVLASRMSRNLFALYCVALHFLVFFHVYWMGAGEADGVSLVGGGGGGGGGAAGMAANAHVAGGVAR